MRYRTEGFSGTGERDAVSVMVFETFELGNTDVFDTLKNGILKNHPVCKEFENIENELEENGYVDDFSEDDKTELMGKILAAVNEVTGKNIKYVLWLADMDTVKSFYRGDEYLDYYDIDAYEESDVVLSELGYDGTLYGYEKMPEKLAA